MIIIDLRGMKYIGKNYYTFRYNISTAETPWDLDQSPVLSYQRQEANKVLLSFSSRYSIFKKSIFMIGRALTIAAESPVPITLRQLQSCIGPPPLCYY